MSTPSPPTPLLSMAQFLYDPVERDRQRTKIQRRISKQILDPNADTGQDHSNIYSIVSCFKPDTFQKFH